MEALNSLKNCAACSHHADMETIMAVGKQKGKTYHARKKWGSFLSVKRVGSLKRNPLTLLVGM
jgi:hypothetical protein